MKCPRCKNEDPSYMDVKNGVVYCRKCISYGKTPTKVPSPILTFKPCDYHLDYQLTSAQQAMSDYLVKRYIDGLNTTIKAVCGAGKTEIVYEVIKRAINLKQRVCFSLPRRELVVELSNRIKAQFINLSICEVYGGNTDNLEGQFVICTTHQLYRYPNTFDLLILDEMDAFPYCNNDILNNILYQSIKGNYIFMSATTSTYDNSLSKRYHQGLVPVPKCIRLPKGLMYLSCILKLKSFKKKGKPVLVFVARIKDTTFISKLLQMVGITNKVVTSKIKDNDKSLSLLKNRKIDCIVCTTVYERGITVDDVQVIVLNGSHPVFDKDTLIQISGRVGRKVPHTTGKIIIYTESKTKEIIECINTITQDNA
ncbi:MAG: helicase-related protein [Thomasclavelia sp.]|nr:helicase-related protein [Thomasclavelia sp.]